jgi:hypothetical protein
MSSLKFCRIIHQHSRQIICTLPQRLAAYNSYSPAFHNRALNTTRSYLGYESAEKFSNPKYVQKKQSQHAYAGADSAPSWRAQQTVALWWPWYTLMASPVDIVHSLAVVSEEAARENRPVNRVTDSHQGRHRLRNWWIIWEGRGQQGAVHTCYQISTVDGEHTVPNPALMAWEVDCQWCFRISFGNIRWIWDGELVKKRRLWTLPTKVLSNLKPSTFQIFTVWSDDAVARYLQTNQRMSHGTQEDTILHWKNHEK